MSPKIDPTISIQFSTGCILIIFRPKIKSYWNERKMKDAPHIASHRINAAHAQEYQCIRTLSDQSISQSPVFRKSIDPDKDRLYFKCAIVEDIIASIGVTTNIPNPNNIRLGILLPRYTIYMSFLRARVHHRYLGW